MSREISTLIGFEVADATRGIAGGADIRIPLAHTAVCGETQASGKTTALEAYITRLGITAVAFLTKRGEGGFRLQTEIQPYFREPEISAETPMWQWVESIFEAMDQSIGRDEKVVIIDSSECVLKLEHYKVKGETRTRTFKSSKAVTTLEEVAENVRLLDHTTTRGRTKAALTLLNAYFKIVLPQIARLKSSAKLELQPGINVMNLIGIPLEMQMLIIRSVIEEIYLRRRKTGVVIPECAKIIPRMRSSPVRLAAEMFTREGLAIGNILMLDSQDLANVATEVLKSIGVWMFGKQSELNERKRASDYIPAVPKITRDDMMQLGKGQFYVVAGGNARKTYVMPAGMEDLHARAIARGEIDASSWNDIRKRLDRAPQRQEDPDESGTPRETRIEVGAAVDSAADQGLDGDSQLSRRGMETHKATEGEEEMPCQNCAKLEERIAHLERQLQSNGIRPGAAPATLQQQDEMRNGPPNLNGNGGPLDDPSNWSKKEIYSGDGLTYEDFYQVMKKRMLRDPEMIARLKLQIPEICVDVLRPTLEMDASSPQGRIALLISQEFFADPQSEEAITKEFKRRGWLGQTRYFADLRLTFHRIVELGFLTKEDGNCYQFVPGMKVTTKEA